MSDKKTAKKVETKQDETCKELKETIKAIHDKEGDDSLILGLNSGIMRCEVIPTGCVTLDAAMGVGGVPRGRMIEIFGPESSGKTTLALTVVANAQRQGGVAAYLDAENALDPSWAEIIGVDLDNLLFSQPDSGEQAFRICEQLVSSMKVDVIVIDSVAALVPQKELDGEVGDQFVGLHARMMSQAMRKLSSVVRKSKTSLIFINQIREKIGIMMPGASNETTPGGRALKFYASMRLDIRRIGSVKAADKAVGNQIRVKVVKNKVAPPFKLAEFDIMFDQGISNEGCLLELGSKLGVVQKSGANYSYNDNRLGIGKVAACEFLKGSREIAQELDHKIRELVFSKITSGEATLEEDPTEETADA